MSSKDVISPLWRALRFTPLTKKTPFHLLRHNIIFAHEKKRVYVCLSHSEAVPLREWVLMRFRFSLLKAFWRHSYRMLSQAAIKVAKSLFIFVTKVHSFLSFQSHSNFLYKDSILQLWFRAKLIFLSNDILCYFYCRVCRLTGLIL